MIAPTSGTDPVRKPSRAALAPQEAASLHQSPAQGAIFCTPHVH